MSVRTGLMEQVIASVVRRGTATVDQLHDEFPDVPRKRILGALDNARDAKKLRIKVRGSFRGKTSSVWEVGVHSEPSRRSRRAPARPLIASVWELGTPRAIPMPQERGRIFNLLGDWNA